MTRADAAIGPRRRRGPSELVAALLPAVSLAVALAGCSRERAESPRAALFDTALECAPPGPCAESAPSFSGPNVLILVFDALRADFVGAASRAWSGEDTFTPALDALASRGAVFANAVASGNWTRPSVASLFTGLRPMRHADWFGGGGENFHRVDAAGRPLAHSLAARFDTAAEVFRRSGYETARFAPTHRGQFHPLSGFHQGFEVCAASPGGTGSVRSDQTLALLADWLECRGEPAQPFFVYVHTLGAHAPYEPPPPYDELYRGKFECWSAEITAEQRLEHLMIDGVTDRQHYLERYAGLVRHADDHLGRLIERLERIGALENTLVIVTADHGETLWDHGRPGHGEELYEETIHVPFVVTGPRTEARMIEAPVELVDVFPTALEFAGITPPGRLDGRSVLGLARGAAQPAERTVVSFRDPNHIAVRSGVRFKYIYSGPAANRGQQGGALFDLEADPLETRDASAEHTAAARGLLRRLRRDVLTQQAGWHLLLDPGPAGPAELSARIRLDALLYGEIDYHCVPHDEAAADGSLSGPCPRTRESSPPRLGVDRAGNLVVRATLDAEALYVHFRPDDPDVTLAFDLRLDGEPIHAGSVFLGAGGDHPAGHRFELGPGSAAAVGLFAGAGVSARLAGPAVRIWRVDYPPADRDTLQDETVDGLRALGYIE